MLEWRLKSIRPSFSWSTELTQVHESTSKLGLFDDGAIELTLSDGVIIEPALSDAGSIELPLFDRGIIDLALFWWRHYLFILPWTGQQSLWKD